MEELERLPGIGPVLAERIVEYRQTAGGFRRVEQLKLVKGIGAKKFERVRVLLEVTSTAKPAGKDREAT
jgi:competence protein ComEA